jgi:predicted RNA-binding protein with RPS1 domain
MMTDETMTHTEPEELSASDTTAAETAQTEPTTEPAAEAAAAQPEPSVEPEAAPEAEAPVAEAAVEAAPEPTPEPAPEPEPEPVKEPVKAEEPTLDDAALFDAYMERLGSDDEAPHEGIQRLSRGDRVEATVIQVDKDKVFVNLGTKSEGVVPLNELTDENVEHASELVKVGDKIQVVVIRPEGADGNLLVSKKRADFEQAWDKIEIAFKDQVTLNAQVVDRVKGGLVVDIGVRGFVPATHVGSGKLRNIEKYVGQTMPLKIIEIDRDRKKVVLSNRQADEERRIKAKEDLFANVSSGDILDGTVRRLTDYGAFVDLGGVDGLLHISEMSWMRINHPREMFKEGQKIKVMVLRLDNANNKISLGHRQVLPDPWNLIRQNYTVGQKLNVKISRLVVAGAFVKLPEGAEAFIPVSEMSNRRIRKPEEVVELEQDVEVQILDLRPDERRMVLSMRAIGGGLEPTRMAGGPIPTWDDGPGDKRGKAGKKGKKGGRGGREDDYDDFGGGRRGFATGGATIGERLGALKGLLGRDDDEDLEDEVEGEAEAEAPAEASADAAPEPKEEE